MPTTCAVRTAARLATCRSRPAPPSARCCAPGARDRARPASRPRCTSARRRRVLAVVTSDGLRLPNALVVAATSPRRAVRATARRQPAGRRRRARARRRPLPAGAHLDAAERTAAPAAGAVAALRRCCPRPPHTARSGARLRAGAARSAQALRTGRRAGRRADALLGLGPGLTPAGDDVLAGALVTSAPPRAPRCRRSRTVHERADATTALSADLLRHAAAGRAAPPVLACSTPSSAPGRSAGPRRPARRRLDLRPRHRHRRAARRRALLDRGRTP
jgi:hypothetical protein